VPELVALDLPGGTGFVDALLAVWDTGDAAAPLDPRLPPAARKVLLDALRPSRIVSSDGDQHRLTDGLPVEDGDALVVATSGTSGRPKGVVLTHEAVAASARTTSAWLGVHPEGHCWLACLPLSHIGGLSVVTRALLTETPLVVMPGFDADEVEEAGRSGRATHVSLVATALRRIDSSVFTCVLLGGSKAPEDLPPNVRSTYGMTETGSGIVYDGVPLQGVEIAIRSIGDLGDDSGSGDSSFGSFGGGCENRVGAGAGTGPPHGEEGEEGEEGEAGEILLRCPMLFSGYRDGSKARIVGPDGSPTWFASGDAGRLANDGTLTVSGRIEDVITTGAEKVWPDVVERVLAEHPGVAEVAVWKRADPEWGERVVAWVVPTDDAPSLEQLRDIVAESLAPWAAPKELVLVDDLPRTAAGKVRRRDLGSFPSEAAPET
jgi:O-succinylbenzoic acid--CoA ligase